jgi:carbon-monoxide dehydrogenase medium subunit
LKDTWDILSKIENDYCLVAGGTWLRTQWEANLKTKAANLVSLENIREMSSINEQVINGKHEIIIGACVTLSECYKSALLNKYVSPLVQACGKIAAPSIRNQATIGGNIHTIAGDAMPALLIANAELLWFNGENIEIESVEKWLITLQANNSQKDNRILVGIKITTDEQEQESFSFFEKIGRRETFTASLVTVAGKGKRQGDGSVKDVALAVGGGGLYPMRLSLTELELESRQLSLESFQQIHKRIGLEFQPTSDPFASAEYKKMVAANLITSELYKVNEKKKGRDKHVAES